jgi:LysR family glycine cleavage system transcriptional activator
VDFTRESVDFAIQFGDGHWPHTTADLLFPDEIEPVCTPRYLAGQAGADRRPDVLLRQRLLVSHYRRNDWDDWLAANRLADKAVDAERMTFSSSILTWQAALDGLGVAIGQKFMLSAELASGQLVRPFGLPLRRAQGHYLVRPEVQRESKKVMAFRDWLLAEAAVAVTGAGDP